MSAVLCVEDVGVHFGALRAVDGMGLEVHPGEIVGLIGPNGAGKSTLVNAVSGLVPLASGSIRIRGEDVTRSRSYERFRAGLGRTFQNVVLAEELTVRQSLEVADARGRYLRAPTGLSGQTRQLCEEIGLTAALDRIVGTLSFMELRLVGIASALAGGSTIALLDEATAGLSRQERQAIRDVLRRLVVDDPSRGLLIIEHDLEFVGQVTDRAVAMDRGRFLCEGATREVLRDRRLVRAYVGEDDA